MAMAQDRDPEDTQANRYINFGMRLGVSVALHPFEYSKILIQVRLVGMAFVPLMYTAQVTHLSLNVHRLYALYFLRTHIHSN